jgi:putative ABC transport system permease protein
MLTLWNGLQLALRALRRNLLRSTLAILGIVIGVAAVIVMVTVSARVPRRSLATSRIWGATSSWVTPGQRMGMGQNTRIPPFRAEDAHELARRLPALAAVAPFRHGERQPHRRSANCPRASPAPTSGTSWSST